jgi:AraC-like DNA-binding protein
MTMTMTMQWPPMIHGEGYQSAVPAALGRADEILTLIESDAARLERPDGDITIVCVDTPVERTAEITREGPATFSITVFLEGSGSLSIDGGTPLNIIPGTAVVFSSHDTVRGTDRFAADQRIRCIDIRFDPTLLARIGGLVLARMGNELLIDCSVPESRAFLIGFPAPAALLHVARDIAACPFRNADVRNLYLRAKALEALALTINTFDSAVDAMGSMGRRVGPRVLQARRLIEQQFDQPWTIERLAKTVGLNERDLKAGFRRIVGRSVHAYLREVRIEAAASMLRDGRSVTEAALDTGFGNLSHFAKAFRQAMGVSPRDYAGHRRANRTDVEQ